MLCVDGKVSTYQVVKQCRLAIGGDVRGGDYETAPCPACRAEDFDRAYSD